MDSSSFGSWSKSLPLAEELSELLASELLSDGLDTKECRLEQIVDLEKDENRLEIICSKFKERLKPLLKDSIALLRTALINQVTDQSNFSHKFALSVSDEEMECGTIENFHKGLQDRIGAPHMEMIDAAMEAEHTTFHGFDYVFLSSNYQIRTTPKIEWELVVVKAIKPDFVPTGDEAIHGRNIPDYRRKLLEDEVKKAKLSKAEVISVILFTGPMYTLYNMILRRRPSDDYRKFSDANNLFATTIFVLVSAVTKLSRVQNIKAGQRLYRGLGGLCDLPNRFYKADENGCKGFLEWGFMSTTSEINVALRYSGVEQKRPKPTVIIVEASSVDRGACIKSMSQYEQEIEYLWVPCSFVEQVGSKYLTITKDGAVTMIPVKINSNLRTSTVEELVAQKKIMHLQSFKFLLLEVSQKVFKFVSKELMASSKQSCEAPVKKGNFDILDHMQVKSASQHGTRDIAELAKTLTETAMTDCSKIYERQDALRIEDYLDSAKYRCLVSEMMIAVELPLLKLQHETGFPFYFTSDDVSLAISERKVSLGSVSDQYWCNDVESVFIKFADPHFGKCPKLIPFSNVRKALNHLALRDVTDEEEKSKLQICTSSTFEARQELDLETFTNLVHTCESASWGMKWAASLPLTELVGRALSCIITSSHTSDTRIAESNLSRKENDPVRFFALMEPAHANILASGMYEHLKETLLNSSRLLRRALSTSSRTSVDGLSIAFDATGALPEFHHYKHSGDLQNFKLLDTMKVEHERTNQFKSVIFGNIQTTPLSEWKLVMRAWHEKFNSSTNSPSSRRLLSKIKFQEMGILNIEQKEEVLEKSEDQILDHLREEEVISVVLASGPMIEEYNRFLRYLDPKSGTSTISSYQTTVFVLMSALRKFTREMKGARHISRYFVRLESDLPALFYKPDQDGWMGFTEKGILYASDRIEKVLGSSDRIQKVSGSQTDNLVQSVLEFHCGSVNHPAYIGDFAQFPEGPMQYLWSPCAFLEPAGNEYLKITEDYVCNVIQVRVNSYFRTSTVDEMFRSKKIAHLKSFDLRIQNVKKELKRREQSKEVKERREKDISPKNISVENFIDCIVKQCEAVRIKHATTNIADYHDDTKYKRMDMDMRETEVFALSKFEEWLENTESSFPEYRRYAHLRTVHRRRIAYQEKCLADHLQEKCLADQLESSQERFKRLCILRGLVVKEIEERNELDETMLMAAAADGRSPSDLELLVRAGADVTKQRKDGVTAIWLAAQFGKVDSVQKLAELKGDVNQAAADGATPVHIAAQSGFDSCIKKLAELGAHLSNADQKGITPLHQVTPLPTVLSFNTSIDLIFKQAAMNGHINCISILLDCKVDLNVQNHSGMTPLDEARALSIPFSSFIFNDKHAVFSSQAKFRGHENCVKKLLRSGADDRLRLETKLEDQRLKTTTRLETKLEDQRTTTQQQPRKIIVSSGDVSDVDGFIACAEYAKTGADLLFVMNYPAYVGVDPEDVYEDNLYEELYPGLGYKYSARELLMKLYRDQSTSTNLNAFIRKDDKSQDDNEKVKSALTDLAFYITNKIWEEATAVEELSGNFYFCIGGVNSVNPFSRDVIKCELVVYSDYLPEERLLLPSIAGVVYDNKGDQIAIDLKNYDEIYLDFNGSMAFLGTETWLYKQLRDGMDSKRCKGVFVSGGVQASEPPKTLSSKSGHLNRLSCATLNQLYHPESAESLFELLSAYGTPCFTVTNNIVANLIVSMHDLEGFMESKRFNRFLKHLARAYYFPLASRPPPGKIYDYYTAFILVAVLSNKQESIPVEIKRAFYSASHGALLVTTQTTWADALKEFLQSLRSALTADHAIDSLTLREIRELELWPALDPIEVFDVTIKIRDLIH